VLLSRATEGDAARRTRMMGIFEISSLVAMIAGYGIAGIAWDSAGPQAFLVLPLLYGLSWVLVSASAPERSTESREHLPVLRLVRALGAERGNLPFAAVWLSVNAVVGVWMQQSPYLLKLPDRSATQSLVGGFTGREIGQVFGVFGLTFLLGVTLWSVFGARMPRRRALAIALVGMLGVVSFLALRNHGAGRWALGLAMACVLVESGFTPAAFAHLADATAVHDGSRGAALGLYSLLLGTGQLLGNALGAPFAMRWQMDGVLALTALLGSVALLGVFRMSPTTRYAVVR
jgi:MFS family permease